MTTIIVIDGVEYKPVSETDKHVSDEMRNEIDKALGRES